MPCECCVWRQSEIGTRGCYFRAGHPLAGLVFAGGVQAVVSLEEHAGGRCLLVSLLHPPGRLPCRTGTLPKQAVLAGTYTASSAYDYHLPHYVQIQVLCASPRVSQ